MLIYFQVICHFFHEIVFYVYFRNMKSGLVNKEAKFGTLPVFFTALSTILGAILFLRFGWAVGQIGFIGTIGIVILGHLVTIPTALAIGEIATNYRVLGGGAYYIVSRSFGLNIGGAIGIALYISQAISVAFYVIAFSEAFEPVLNIIQDQFGWGDIDKRFVSIPTMTLLSFLMLTRGANMGMKALYVVMALIMMALVSFFLGGPIDESVSYEINAHITNNTDFFYVFTIIFPAFTGLAAGLGLSGDLRDPKRSIPRGTIWASIVGMLIYCLAAYKLAISAPAGLLAEDQLIMQRIAIWGPIIPLGLAAATISSALGSIIVAPRTLQAIGFDNILPLKRANKWMSKGKAADNEPVNASIISIIIAFFFVFIGELNFVAEIISMIFVFTYGALCLISFMEHFAADTSYRPSFRSRWYISLIGAVFSFWVMFKMNSLYAAGSLLFIFIVYYSISSSNKDKKGGLEKLFRGVLFQLSRSLQIFAQRAGREEKDPSWRPFAVCISENSFERRSAFDFMRWISYKYGFGTYIHYIEGFFNKEASKNSEKVLKKLLNLAKGYRNRLYLDTIISPSYTSAIAQVIQLSSISGRTNNLILFEFSRTDPQGLDVVMENLELIRSGEFDICLLSSSYKGFGHKQEIHIWSSREDFTNLNTMILLAYIILGHPEWHNGMIKILAVYPEKEWESRKAHLTKLIKSGRLPISSGNIEIITEETEDYSPTTISNHSANADLCMIGLGYDAFSHGNITQFNQCEKLGNMLFVCSENEKPIN